MHGELVAKTGVFGDTDFAGIARALGAEAVTVRRVTDLRVVRDWCAQGCRGTLVLDCKIVRDVKVAYMSHAGKAATGGSVTARRT
jgi:thiamine pyrophosphate-dependent acetolactate synthase large subunit-like protein